MYRLRHQNPRTRRITALFVGTTLAAVCMTALLLGSRNSPPPKVIANDLSGRPTACLAADSQTASKTSEVTQTWAAMQSGARGLKINVQQLILVAKNPSQAQPYLAGLLEQHCTFVVTVGRPFGQAIPSDQKLAPHTHFLAIDAGALSTNAYLQSSTADNLTLVRDQVRSLAA